MFGSSPLDSARRRGPPPERKRCSEKRGTARRAMEPPEWVPGRQRAEVELLSLRGGYEQRRQTWKSSSRVRSQNQNGMREHQ